MVKRKSTSGPDEPVRPTKETKTANTAVYSHQYNIPLPREALEGELLGDEAAAIPIKTMGGQKAKPELQEPIPVNIDGPVHPYNWLSYSNNESGETGLAAYLLFRHVKWLRRLVISWPILIMFSLYGTWSRGLTKLAPLEILGSESTRNVVTAVTDPIKTWPVNGEVDASGTLICLPHEKNRVHKNYRMAWILVGVVHLCRHYNDLGDERNHSLNKWGRWEFMKQWGVILSLEDLEIRMPQFGFWEDRGETAFEAYNRAWEILKYLGEMLPGYPGDDYVFMGRADTWAKRMQTRQGMDEGFFTQQDNLPPWMKDDWDSEDEWDEDEWDPDDEPHHQVPTHPEAGETELCATDLLLSWDDIGESKKSHDLALATNTGTEADAKTVRENPLKRKLSEKGNGTLIVDEGGDACREPPFKASAPRPNSQASLAQYLEDSEEDSEEDIWDGRSKRRRTQPPNSSPQRKKSSHNLL
ncbi:Helicase C-terminal [Penicillium brevicompactum]|uniref:Helicase C-terminal n=1 Tax=Penicillium brevicompactum TaxID=5074 RepID=UPI00253F87A8|nr:Helicase C-terminal [Penicillium brevicompactum]KAJ5319103.1 Helicase C-terminal [Penicillium brevicompactum]